VARAGAHRGQPRPPALGPPSRPGGLPCRRRSSHRSAARARRSGTATDPDGAARARRTG